MDVRRNSWQERTIAGEQALEKVMAESRFLFGRGPRLRAAEPEERAAALLAVLGSNVRAVRWCRQVHGKTLASLSAEPDTPPSSAACVGRCDGLISADPGVGLMVWTADCVPVLLAGGGVAAAIHAGWRGAASGVVKAAVRRVQVEYGVAPDSLTVALGPAVGACHYRVGEEVVEALRRTGVDPNWWLRNDRVDLRGFLIAELESLGVPAEACEVLGGCTACDPGLSSYRRDGDRAGRQWSMVVTSRATA